MKLVTAIVRPEKLAELLETLAEGPARGLTVSQVSGFGRQLGRTAPDAGLAAARKPVLLPKARLDIMVLDDDAETVVQAIAKHARTGTIGDGKIWVTPVDAALRVRTGDRDRAAV
jgi:nitrogen regulatory protein PII